MSHGFRDTETCGITRTDVNDTVQVPLRNLRNPDLSAESDVTDLQVNAQKAAVQGLDEVVRSRAATLRQSHNARLPINQLPVEILQRILLYAIGDASSYRPTMTVMGVCARWAGIVRACPSFWCHARLEHRLPFVETLPERSKAAPLFVTCSEGSVIEFILFDLGVNRPDRDKTAAFIAAISLHVRRWNTACLALATLDENCLTQAAPNLVRLDLRLPRDSGPLTPAIELFGGDAPRLAHVELSSVPVRWASPIFQDLTTLRLSDYPSAGPTIVQLIQRIRSSPKLSEFHLERVVISASGPTENLASPILLQHLQHCHMGALDIIAWDILVSCFDLPTDILDDPIRISLDLSLFSPVDITTGQSHGFAKVLAWLLLPHSNQYALELNLLYRSIMIKAIDDNNNEYREFNISGREELLETSLPWIINEYGGVLAQRLKRLTLTDILPPAMWTNILTRLINLNELRVVKSPTVDAVLLCLSQPTFQGNVGTWPCSKLEALYLIECEWQNKDALLEMVKRRHGATLGFFSGLTVQLPREMGMVNLEKCSVTEAMHQQLGRAMPKGIDYVIWDGLHVPDDHWDDPEYSVDSDSSDD